MSATIILGREGMGELSNEDEFEAWYEYVDDRIDELVGFVVLVEYRGKHDVQSTDVRADGDDEKQAVKDALVTLWDDFCAEGDPPVYGCDCGADETKRLAGARTQRGGGGHE